MTGTVLQRMGWKISLSVMSVHRSVCVTSAFWPLRADTDYPSVSCVCCACAGKPAQRVVSLIRWFLIQAMQLACM